MAKNSNRYTPVLSTKHQYLFDTIQATSEEIARKKRMPSVIRDISVYVVMDTEHKLISKMNKYGMDAVGFFHELHFKYNVLDYKVTVATSDEKWKRDQEEQEIDDRLITPDISFLTVLGKHLASNASRSTTTLLWNALEETIQDANNLEISDENKDKRYWSLLMDKYLTNYETDPASLYIDRAYNDKTSDGSTNAKDITETNNQNEENLDQPSNDQFSGNTGLDKLNGPQ